MNIGEAQRLDDAGECAVCEEEGMFVDYDGDKVCRNCSYAPQPRAGPTYSKTEWEQWWDYRSTSDDVSGATGEDRKRLVGGFISAWDEFDF